MPTNYKKLISVLGKDRMLINEPLSKYTSFRLGGSSDLLFKAKTQSEMVKAVNSARKLKIPYFVLGSGTNLLISDRGIRGLVIKNESNAIKLVGIRGGRKGSEKKNIPAKINTVYLEVESGVIVNRLVRFTLEQSLAGFEPFLGQPGTVGGAIYTNAHNVRMGSFFGERIIEAKLLDVLGEVKKVPGSYFRFGYDRSILSQTKELVLSVTLKLETAKKDAVWKKATEALEYRKKTQPSGVFSAGCVFRNIEKSESIRLATPNYTCSAGYLLERAGLKGVSFGDVCFSDRHSNFIVNRGNAKASDVLELIKLAKRQVKAKFGISLKEEIGRIGEF